MLRENTKTSGVLVCGEVRKSQIHSVTKELLGKAREIADKKNTFVYCLLVCGDLTSQAEELFDYGADKIILATSPDLDLFNQDIAAKILVDVIKRYLPEIVIAPATTAGRTYLPYAAAKIHTGLTADCTGLDVDAETGLLMQTRPAIGGNVLATIKTPDHVPQMATVRPKTFRIPAPIKRPGTVERYIFSEDTLKSRVESTGIDYSDATGGDIQDKEVIISGGKGLKRPENFALVKELAELLGGGVGASRPTVEAKWIEYPHQVGLSGKVVAPKFYLAAGISGAIQHLAGMQTAQKIVAVNKDPDAPIFQIADIALCGDLTDILPKIIDRVRQEMR